MIDPWHIWTVIYMIDVRRIWNVIYNARSNRSHPPTAPNTAPATQNDCDDWSASHMKRHLQWAEQQESQSIFTKYCTCHAKWISRLIRVTYETSFTMSGATTVTGQVHQILRLPRQMNLMIDPRHIWNVIYNARSNNRHRTSSPNTAPATQNESHDWSASHMKRHLQCAEQAQSASNLTKYCACHEICKFKISAETPWIASANRKTIRTDSDHDPTMIRPWSDDKIVISHPPLRRPYSSDLGDDFVLKNTTFRAPAISQNVTKCCACHEKSHSNQQILRLARKMHSTLLYSILSWHLFPLGIYSLLASIPSWHLFLLGIYSL